MSSLQFSFNVSAAESFLNDVSRQTNSYYMMISRPQAWTDENTPDTSKDSVMNQVEVWKNAIAAKKITPQDVRLVIDRNDWQTGTYYSQFSDNDEIFRAVTYDTNPFFVLTSDYRVYKCLDNNGNTASTVEPTHTYSELQTPGEDGYVWQFMYQLKEDDFDFVTDDYIPVSIAGSTTKIGTIEYLQREIQENARGGGIFNVRVNRSGGYWSAARILKGISGSIGDDFYNTHKITNIENDQEYYYDGTTYDVARFTVIGMNSFSKDTYHNWALTDLDMGSYITNTPSGTNYTQINFYKKIVGHSGDYVYTERFDSTPVTTTGWYNVVPYLYVSNGTGSTQEENAVIYPVFDGISQDYAGIGGASYDNEGILNSSKTISRVRSLEPGVDLYQPNILILTPSTSASSGAGFDATAFATPLGGHGSNAVHELGANKIMIRTLLKGSEGGAFDVQNDFRQFSVIRNPQNAGWTSGVTAGSVAGNDVVNNTVLELRNDINTALIDFHTEPGGTTHPSDAFVVGQKVHQGNYSANQARGTVLSWLGDAAGKLTVSVDNGKFRASVDPDEVLSSVTAGRIFYGETTGTGYTWGGDGTSYGGFIDSVSFTKSFVNTSFPANSVVYGMDSGSTAKVEKWSADADGERGTLTLSRMVGDFIGPRVALGTQLDGETIFGFATLTSNGTVTTSSSPVGVITKIKKVPVNTDESHRLTQHVRGFFEDSTFQLDNSLLDQPLRNTDSDFYGKVVSFNYTEGTTSGISGSTVDFYVTDISGSVTGGDVLSFNGYTGSFVAKTISEFLPYTGQVLYIENIRPVQRNADQDEELKLVIEF